MRTKSISTKIRSAAAVFMGAALVACQPGPAEQRSTDVTAKSRQAVVSEELSGDRWLRHHIEDLLPNYSHAAALGTPVGNFPTFRDGNGQTVTNTNRNLAPMARQVYGYALSYMLTGDEKYLGWARAGINYIEAKFADKTRGGYYPALKIDGTPVNLTADKDSFGLSSLGLAYGMYFNATRDPAIEALIYKVRDLLFDPAKYYIASEGRIADAMTANLATRRDTNNDGHDIVASMGPATALLMQAQPYLSTQARRDQFLNDMRVMGTRIQTSHRQGWYFWGRSAQWGNFAAMQTDFGHPLKAWAMVYNINKVLPDHPWDNTLPDMLQLINNAWDAEYRRWSAAPNSLTDMSLNERMSSWWQHADAEQLLATLSMAGMPQQERLQQSVESWFRLYVDYASPVRDNWNRVDNNGVSIGNLVKTGAGKNFFHNMEHMFIMAIHGRFLENAPIRLHYAVPADQALSFVARPYWFGSSRQYREVTGGTVAQGSPGHVKVVVDLGGLNVGRVEATPADSVKPTSQLALSSEPNAAGWNNSAVTAEVVATDDVSGVKEVHVRITGNGVPRSFIEAGSTFSLTLDAEGTYTVESFAVDNAGNVEAAHVTTVKIDKTAPVVVLGASSPAANAAGWNNSDVSVSFEASDALSGLASTSPNPLVISAEGAGVTGTVTATDVAGNTTSVETAAFNIDKTAPVISGIPSICTVWPPNGEMVAVASLSVSDAASGAALEVSGSASGGDGDALAISGGAVSVRAERSGREKNGRVYSISASSTDLAGNSASGSFQCVVPHDQGKK